MLEQHPVQDTHHSSHRTNEGATKRKKPHQETSSWPGYSWWWTCVPGRSSAGHHSWNWKLLHRHHHFLWTLTHNHTAQPDVSSHMRTLHTSSKMYLKPAPRGAWHILILSSDKPDHFHFADPSMLVLSIFLKHWTDINLKFLHTPEFHSTHASSIYFCSSLPQLFPCLNVPQ